MKSELLNNDNFKHVTFHPACVDKDYRRAKQLEDPSDVKEEDKDYILSWHGVRITNKEMASSIVKDRTATYSVNPKYLDWVANELKESRWVKFKKWLLTLFRLRR